MHITYEKILLKLEFVWYYNNDCFLKIFFIKRFIKIIFFLKFLFNISILKQFKNTKKIILNKKIIF